GIRDFSRDWSSDVCSSDLMLLHELLLPVLLLQEPSMVNEMLHQQVIPKHVLLQLLLTFRKQYLPHQYSQKLLTDQGSCSWQEQQIGRASCRERVKNAVVAG